MLNNENESVFEALPKSTLIQVGLVILCGASGSSMLRITHIFSATLYAMPVSTPGMVRYAVRPAKYSLSSVESKIGSGEWTVGRLKLPAEFLTATDQCEENFAAIEPVLRSFETERYLGRTHFTKSVSNRAEELGISSITLRRLLIRYYYFGRTKFALQPLKRGPNFLPATLNERASVNQERVPKRRGRQPAASQVLGRNDFVVMDEDISDMVECFQKMASKAATTKVHAHSEYLRIYFQARHPKIYRNYLDKQCPLPVTVRQFRDAIRRYADIPIDHAKNVAGERKRARAGSAEAVGPGEVYEIDATGLRIHLVDSSRNVILGTPILYVIVDRWSRFIVSVYLSLRPASWEEMRTAILIAFTPRSRRFKTMGVDVDEADWPQGRICSRIVNDRGSEMISRNMLNATVEGLGIQTDTLPPKCPDGKGVIERLNREIKRQMAQRKLKGAYAKRPTDPDSHKAYKDAKMAAVYSLREIWWEVIRLVNRHNNKSHSYLEKKPVLKMAGIPPTPKNAYVWGLEHITGLESPPHSESDYLRMLLAEKSASIGNGYIMWKDNKYFPENSAAERLARKSTSRRSAIEIRVDLSDPVELYTPAAGEEWGRWRVNSAGMQSLSEMTIEEAESFGEVHQVIRDIARNDAFISDQIAANAHAKKKKPKRNALVAVDAETRKKIRANETNAIKSGLMGKTEKVTAKNRNSESQNSGEGKASSWEEIERAEKMKTVTRMRRGGV